MATGSGRARSTTIARPSQKLDAHTTCSIDSDRRSAYPCWVVSITIRAWFGEQRFAGLIASHSTIEVLAAVHLTTTLAGVERLARAEEVGRQRSAVLQAITRRLQQLSLQETVTCDS